MSTNRSMQQTLPPLLSTFIPEMQLLICCARVEMVEPFFSHIHMLLADGLDWAKVIPLAGRHGMVALLHKHLSKVPNAGIPASFLAQLRGRNKSHLIHQLTLTSRMLKINKLLDDARIPHLHYKGIVLDQLLYGGVMLRATGDMDILVRKKDVFAVKDILVSNDYQGFHVQDSTNNMAEEALLEHHKDYVFNHLKHNHMVEVHWKLTTLEVSDKFEWSYFASNFQTATLNGTELQTFNAEDMYQTLCMHGVRHQFERLKWLTDLSQLILQKPDLDWVSLLERAEEAGVKRMILTSSYLVHSLMGVAVPHTVIQAIESQKIVQKLGQEACKQLTSDGSISRDAVERYAFEIRLLDHWHQRLRYVAIVVSSLSSREVHENDMHPIRGIYRYGVRAFNIIRRRGIGLLLRTFGRMVGAIRK